MRVGIPASIVLAATLVCSPGCGRTPQAVGNIAVPPTSRSGPLLVDLLKSHGEKDVVSDASGIGAKGNPTRIHVSRYGATQSGNGSSVEMEFRIGIGGGKEIVEYVAGVGVTEDKAENDAVFNFVMTTFHPVYKVFINPKDPHQTLDKLPMANGTTREIAAGDMLVRGGNNKKQLDIGPVRDQIRKIVANRISDRGRTGSKLYTGRPRAGC